MFHLCKHFVDFGPSSCYNKVTKALLNILTEDTIMSIGSNIKKLRRERDITQEQLAEYLGITSRAVSQWECDRTAPDISMLPALCHIFDVTSDTLLGIDITKNNELIEDCLKQAQQYEYDGKFEECAAILREGYGRFPKAYRIMERLANAIVCVNSRRGIKDYDEVIDLCCRILTECTDSKIRYDAIDTLATAYGCAGKQEEMLKLAEEMPRSHYSYENFMLYRWQGDADLPKRQDYLAYLINQLLSMLACLSGHMNDNRKWIYSPEDRIRLKKLQVDLLELLFPDGDYQYNAQNGEIACSQLVTIYLRGGDIENAWQWLARGAAFAMHADTYDENAPHTSPILRGYSDGGWIMEADGNRSQSLLDWLTTDPEAEPLRADPRSATLCEQLRAVAKKP